MNNIFNKALIFIGLIAFFIRNDISEEAIFTVVVTIALTAFLEYFNSVRLNVICFFSYSVISLICPQFILFLPVIFYDIIFTKYQLLTFTSLIPFFVHIDIFADTDFLILFIVIIVGILLKNRTLKAIKLQNEYMIQRDNLTESTIAFEHKIKELTDRQDAEINLATLNERNRIAREIHDNVGHLLSSSILQIGAIMAVTKEENTKKNLEAVKNTLDSGMNSIRNSVHNLHDNSIDLYAQLNELIKEFTFCPVIFDYEITSKLDVKIKYAIIAIVKEALANVIKHSNATNLKITLYEHPSIYQLIVLDNGTSFKKNMENGMGLESIRQRVNALDGIVNFSNSGGFRIFISFRKK